MAIIYPIGVYCKGNFLDFKIFIYSNEWWLHNDTFLYRARVFGSLYLLFSRNFFTHKKNLQVFQPTDSLIPSYCLFKRNILNNHLIKHRMKYSALFIFSVSILINICCINIIQNFCTLRIIQSIQEFCDSFINGSYQISFLRIIFNISLIACLILFLRTFFKRNIFISSIIDENLFNFCAECKQIHNFRWQTVSCYLTWIIWVAGQRVTLLYSIKKPFWIERRNVRSHSCV